MDSTSRGKLVSTLIVNKKEINLYLPENKTKKQENFLVGKNYTQHASHTDKFKPNFQKSHTPFHRRSVVSSQARQVESGI